MKALKIILPILVLILAVLGMKKLVATKKAPARTEVAERVIPVNVITVHSQEVIPLVEAAGTVMAARQIELRAQVGGQIMEISDELQPGGFLRKDQTVLHIDDRDYLFAVERRKADVARATFEVTNEKGMSAVAEQEWALLGKDLVSSPEGRELTLRKPHMRNAEAALKAAQSSLAEAELNLSRTIIKAPFNAQILRENVDPGQVITPQTMIATLVGTDRYWVQTSIPLEKLDQLALPNRDGEGGAHAEIIHQSGKTQIVKSGRVIRLLGDLDEAGRLARVLVAVDDPLGLDTPESTLPLLLDAYVRVTLDGKPIEDAYVLPPHTLHEGNQLWVVDSDNRLEIREVEIAWSEKQRMVISKGLADGDRVISSRIATPLPGLKLSINAEAEPLAQAGGDVE